MSADDRVKVLENEFKLIKSELRQTLGSVRDFLLDLKIPQIQEVAAKEAERHEQLPIGGGGGGGSSSGGSSDQIGSQGSIPESYPSGFEPQPSLPEMGAPVEDLTNLPLESPLSEEEPLCDSVDMPEDQYSEDTGITAGDMPGEKEPEGPAAERGAQNPQAGVPQVNLLANLIRWASAARKDIGLAQLPTFLDVYATTGNLSQETRDTILNLAEVATDPVDEKPDNKNVMVTEEIALCMEINSLAGQLPPEYKEKLRRLTDLILRQSVYANKADVWSQLLLELHGILTGGGRSLQPLVVNKDTWKEDTEEDRVEIPEESACEEESAGAVNEVEEISKPRRAKPARLRLVLPVDGGAEQELDLGSLFISTDAFDSTSPPAKKGNVRKNYISPKR
jgi:hypothetical protein